MPHPFGRAVTFAMGREYTAIGAGESLYVDLYDAAGRLLRSLRGPNVMSSIDETFLDGYRGEHLQTRDSSLRARLADAEWPMPDALPAYDDIRIDPDGNIWVQRFQPSWERLNRWGVFAGSGEFLGHVEMPLDFRVQQIGSDFVLGVTKDELDVERVEMYALDRR